MWISYYLDLINLCAIHTQIRSMIHLVDK